MGVASEAGGRSYSEFCKSKKKKSETWTEKHAETSFQELVIQRRSMEKGTELWAAEKLLLSVI